MKNVWMALGVLWAMSGKAYSFPEIGRTVAWETASDEIRATYNFEGIVALSGCSGSLVRFEDSDEADQAMVLTNGHCVRLLDPGLVLVNQNVSRSFDVLSPTASKLGSVQAVKLIYATMTKTDMALYLLKETYVDILKKFKTRPLTLSSEAPAAGTAIEVISGYWKRGYSCEIEATVEGLKEGRWLFEDSLRYSRPGCEVIGGTSGSPVIEAGTRTVIAVNNTINERGARCEVNNPCEIDQNGDVTQYKKGLGYAQQTAWVYSCRAENGELDLNVAGCLLPKPVK